MFLDAQTILKFGISSTTVRTLLVDVNKTILVRQAECIDPNKDIEYAGEKLEEYNVQPHYGLRIHKSCTCDEVVQAALVNAVPSVPLNLSAKAGLTMLTMYRMLYQLQ